MKGRYIDRAFAVVLYFGTVVPVFWWAPSPWDYVMVFVLVTVMWPLYHRLRHYRLAGAFWQRQAEQRYTFEDVHAFLLAARNAHEQFDPSWMALDAALGGLRVRGISGGPLAGGEA